MLIEVFAIVSEILSDNASFLVVTKRCLHFDVTGYGNDVAGIAEIGTVALVVQITEKQIQIKRLLVVFVAYESVSVLAAA